MNVSNIKQKQRKMKGVMQRALGLYTDEQIKVASEVVAVDNKLSVIRSRVNGHERLDYNSIVSDYHRTITKLCEDIRKLPIYDRDVLRERKDVLAALELSMSNMQFIMQPEPKRLNTINIILLCDRLVSLEIKSHNVPF